jgi:predicted nucleic acid-binding Zn ribbon protein
MDVRVGSPCIGADVRTVIAAITDAARPGWAPGGRPQGRQATPGRGRVPVTGPATVWPVRRATGAHRARRRGRPARSVVTAATGAGHLRPASLPGRPVAGFVRPVAIADLPVAAAMAGAVQPRGRDGVELPCLVCGEPFMARRVDRRTCSPGCASRDRAGRTAARLQRLGRACEACGRMFVAGRADTRFCSSRCRLRAYRRRRRATPTGEAADTTCQRAG